MFDKDKEVQKFIKDEFKKGKTKEEIAKELKKRGQSFYLNNLNAYPDTNLFLKYKKWHHILITSLITLIPLRLLSVPVSDGMGFTILMMVLVLAIPIILILSLRTHTKQMYLIVGTLGLLSLGNSFRYNLDNIGPLSAIEMGLYVFGLVVLISITGFAFLLYVKLFPKKTKE